jgi:hypothetical protein
MAKKYDHKTQSQINKEEKKVPGAKSQEAGYKFPRVLSQ